MHTTTQKLAFALEQGLRVAYAKHLRPAMRRTLFEMLDDMALALSHHHLVEEDPKYKEASWMLSSICDNMDVPIPTQLRQRDPNQPRKQRKGKR